MVRSGGFRTLVGLLLLAVGACAWAGDEQGEDSRELAQVEHVTATELSGGSWRFEVTVLHNDEGWDHYADAWQILDPRSGQVLGERILAHPHENEQPFTRSLGGITIPPDLRQVLVRARCNVHGFGGREVLVDLLEPEGERYRVVHLRP